MMGASRGRPKRFRIGALELMSGVTRDAIHHYVELGILPAPEKTAATVAWYDRRHVDALERVRALRAAGVPLVRIARVLGELAPDAPVSEVSRVGRMLAPRERSPLPVARDNLDAPTRALAERVGFGDAPELDGGMRGALAELLALDDAAREHAVARLRRAVESLRALRPMMAASLFGAVAEDERVEDALGRSERARHAVRSTLAAAWDQLERQSWEDALRVLGEEVRRAGPSPFFAAAPAAVEGATLRLVVLESRDDLDAWRERLRLTLGTGSAKRLGETARAALAAGVQDPWVELSLGVAHVDGRRYADARDVIARALAARPRWCLARAFAVAAEVLYHADRGTALEAAAAPAQLAAVGFDDEPSLAAEARARLVVAQTAAALPHAAGAGALARARCDALLALLDAVPSEDQRRATGELARLEGNAWLLRARLCAAEGDGEGARRWLARAVAVPGAVGRAARGLSRASEDGNDAPEPARS
jgi:DNA-binding transcriptional MerR regulator